MIALGVGPFEVVGVIIVLITILMYHVRVQVRVIEEGGGHKPVDFEVLTSEANTAVALAIILRYLTPGGGVALRIAGREHTPVATDVIVGSAYSIEPGIVSKHKH